MPCLFFYAIFTKKPCLILNTQLKVRILLLLLTLVFALTAITFHTVFDKQEILTSEARILERNLRAKEEYIIKFLGDPANFEALKTADKNEAWALKFIPEFRDQRRIFIQTFLNHQPQFWNSIRVFYRTDQNLPEGSTFVLFSNGWYEAIKKSSGNFSVVCYIPVKSKYPFTNQYLKNDFSDDLIRGDNLEIASIHDREVYNVKNIDGKYLFSVKLKSASGNTFLTRLELLMWVMSVISFSVLITYLCVWAAQKGYVISAILAMYAVFRVLRYLNVKYRSYHDSFAIDIFDTRHYSTAYYHSIGDFLINVLFAVWLSTFIYYYRDQIRFSVRPLNRILSAVIFFILGLIIVLIGYQIERIFNDLIFKSNISFDVTNVLSLSGLSWLGILLLCLCLLCFWLITEAALSIGKSLNITNKERLIIILIWFGIAFFNRLVFFNLTLFFLLFGALICIQAWRVYVSRGGYTSRYFVMTISVLALMVSFKLAQFQEFKEEEQRKSLIGKLEYADDPNAVLLFSNIENEILSDQSIQQYFSSNEKQDVFEMRLKQRYLSGYLSHYDFQAYAFNTSEKIIKDSTRVSLSSYKNLVLAGSIKVSDYFYRINNTFGYQNYFALLPIRDHGETIGTLVLELKSQQVAKPLSHQGILSDTEISEDVDLSGYSYAFYQDGKLLTQYGRYTYSLVNYDFNAGVKEFSFVERRDVNDELYSHLVYKPNQFKLIVVSRPVKNFTTQLAAISFIFIVLSAFTIAVILLKELWINFQSFTFDLNRYRVRYFSFVNHMLYKTRIQLSMVVGVVSTLVIAGIITFYNIGHQYRSQQNQDLLDQINRINDGFDNQLFKNGTLPLNTQTELAFKAFAEVNAADLNLYSTSGDLVFTTQPRLYQSGLIAPKMNSKAYLYLHRLQKREYVNDETLGHLRFITAYSAIKNNRNEPIGYLSLPHLTNEQEYQARVAVFLNALINVYTLVFVAIGFFAVFIANQITSPLTLIQKILSQTNIGRKNEPIVWKRQDEIGNLIKEYNNMILALEDSANKLARSERESAWREMAKQIAHEIKNPLTPLKLGVQLLEKSWSEKDPNFDKKFEKFSKSFIEQIESLSLIASEFSNFAKMPDTVLERVDLKEIIGRSIEVYQQLDQVDIVFSDYTAVDVSVMGDKDQLLRSFNNLIKNSTEAIPQGRRGRINITMQLADGDVKVILEDNGNGIPESVQERIFMPNFTTKSSGTGLGLAFVKQAVENMGGSISYETTPGKGTTFYVTIPLAA